MNTTYKSRIKFRIYPNREQKNFIHQTLGCHHHPQGVNDVEPYQMLPNAARYEKLQQSAG
ncbi:helix-turn-helix domain-containing protein [Fusicatenibacter sp.]